MRTMMALAAVAVVVAAAGCQARGGSDELCRLLPDRPGYMWVYHGFAEYGLTAELVDIARSAGETVYVVRGEEADVSDGESDRDRSVALEYRVDGEQLVQRTVRRPTLETEFAELVLIRRPLVVGNWWQQTVTDGQGRSVMLRCEIVAASDEEPRSYTVRYEEVGGDHYELRAITEGVGVVSFRKRLDLAGEAFEAGYDLTEWLSGY